MTAHGRQGAPVGQPGGCAPVVLEIADHVIGFYIGRGLTGPSPLAGVEGNWVDVEWDLGEINYAICVGDHAVVYDTMPLPELGRWMREHLTEERGIRRFTVVLSHWHLDHIAGNCHFADGPIVARELTRGALVEHREAIAAGTLWGPPAIDVVLPTITFERRLDLFVGGLRLELHGYDIHSPDANLLYIPEEQLLLAGDALEDTLSYVVEPGDISTHLAELDRLRTLPVERILPQHGGLEAIQSGGYAPAFIDAMSEYNRNLLGRLDDPGYIEAPVEDFMPEALEAGAVQLWEPYRAIHAQNVRACWEHYRGGARVIGR